MTVPHRLRASHHRPKEVLRRKASSSDISPPNATVTPPEISISGPMRESSSMKMQQPVTNAHGTATNRLTASLTCMIVAHQLSES